MTTKHETYTSPTDYLTKRLREELKALDAHEKETRRLLDTGESPQPGGWIGRHDDHDDLVARVVETARSLSKALP